MNVIIDKGLNEATGYTLEHSGNTKSLIKVVDMISFLLGVQSEDVTVKVFLSSDEESMTNETHEGDLLITKVNVVCEAVKVKETEKIEWCRLW